MSSTYWVARLAAVLIVPTLAIVISVTRFPIQKNAAKNMIANDAMTNAVLVVFPRAKKKTSTTWTTTRATATYPPASSTGVLPSLQVDFDHIAALSVRPVQAARVARRMMEMLRSSPSANSRNVEASARRWVASFCCSGVREGGRPMCFPRDLLTRRMTHGFLR
jgi:hypothetical protein